MDHLEDETGSGGGPRLTGVRVGLILPVMEAGAAREGIEAGAETAERLSWSRVWTTDHVLVDRATEKRYGRIFEALTTLAWVGARCPTIGLGTSVVVVPQRNAVVLAKELATIDVLSGGRLTAGVGVGWNDVEFANLGMAERFHRRGAYLDETIALWCHLWSGSREPFDGRFHRFSDFAFEPLPVRRAIPIVVGARSEAGLRRAARLADGYHATSTSPAELAPRVSFLQAEAAAAGRPLLEISARVSVRFDAPAGAAYTMHGTDDEIATEVRAFVAAGATELGLHFGEDDPGRLAAAMERFERQVLPAVRES